MIFFDLEYSNICCSIVDILRVIFWNIDLKTIKFDIYVFNFVYINQRSKHLLQQTVWEVGQSLVFMQVTTLVSLCLTQWRQSKTSLKDPLIQLECWKRLILVQIKSQVSSTACIIATFTRILPRKPAFKFVVILALQSADQSVDRTLSKRKQLFESPTLCHNFLWILILKLWCTLCVTTFFFFWSKCVTVYLSP